MSQNLATSPTFVDFQAEANKNQRAATAPEQPVWVGASAGSGKTRVLVNRLLRLMLPGANREASPPYKILCITFTKAGAAEVMDRVVKILRGWAIANETALNKDLEELLEVKPDKALREKARALFAEVIETPGGMKIMTIHAFCESVLARFPMEAGLPAGFEVMEEAQSKALMRDVRRAVITRLQLNAPEDKALKAAFDHLSTIRNAEQIETLMERIFAERGRLRALLARYTDITGVAASVEKALNVPANANPDALIDQFCVTSPEAALRALLPRMAGCKTKGNQSCAQTLASFFAVSDRAPLINDYRLIFLKADGDARKLVGVLKGDPEAESLFAHETARFQQLDATLRDISTAQSTNALLRFSTEALAAYEAAKRQINRLDFEDLIDRTKRLLSGDGVNWVQYKLDGGIDHILVDEAQDTNPDQWDIITSLYDEFYAGSGLREDMQRTTFVVGDEKQSIFSFQRADPRVFAQMHDRLEDRAENAQMPLQTIPMRISFRSSPSILRMVDEVFAPADMRRGVLQNPDDIMRHDARFSGKAGHVELWPLIKKPEKTARFPWARPLKIEADENPVHQMAERIAKKIRGLLDDPKELLQSKDRRIRPGDIMILLSKRKPLAEPILKALRQYNVPVSGIDRMVVTRQLAVQDVLACIAFTLQPDDDLNLAALLKTPFIGLNEQQLFDLAHERQKRPLWQVVKEKDGPIAAWLAALLSVDGSVSRFLHHVLFTPCPNDSRSGMRALTQRLGADIRDPLQELLARADDFDARDVRGLQGFLQDAQNDDSEIKRDLQEGDDRVRVLTVHGSKGLEAPIVFMPDTIRATSRGGDKNPVYWPERGDSDGVPLWVASSANAANLYNQRKADAASREDEEYRRLLYVALTRAAERLYIGGVQKSDDSYTDRVKSWYFPCETAIKAIGHEQDGLYILENRQTDPVRKDEKKETREATAKPESWMFEPAPAPESPPRPLMPSKPEADDPAVMSPLFGDISHRYQRGRIIHTLFQFLPELPPEERLPRAAAWLMTPAHRLSVPAQNEILEATFNVLNDPQFAALFSKEARVEVPLTGHLQKPDGSRAIVSGQIDRLLVSDSQVLILDYKTNRPAPKDISDVPEAYRRQMRTYRDILAAIWPQKAVSCALLWTDGPALMDITGTL